jgi:hypothetical protein
MRKAAALFVLLAIAGLMVAYYATGSSAEESGRTIRVFEKETAFETLDLGAKGESSGDQEFFTSDLFKVKSDGTQGAKVGKLVGSCTTSIGGLGECKGTFLLKQGQILGAVVLDNSGPVFTAAIFGGTGAYREARGEVVFDRNKGIDTIRIF